MELNKVTITGKRKWKEGKFQYMECYCNGHRLFDRWEGGGRDIEDGMKNTCKLIKLFGLSGYENYYKNSSEERRKVHIAVHECELPEWDSLPFN
jgi:hypothetical protein